MDRIVSGDRCSAGFARNGALLLYGRDEPADRYNLFTIPLQEILLGALPRKAARSSLRLQE